jgi:hypothetical protein
MEGQFQMTETQPTTTTNPPATAADIARAIDAVAYAVSRDTTRYNLCGVRLEMRQGDSWAIATDGHRAAFCRIGGELPAPAMFAQADAKGRIGVPFPSLEPNAYPNAWQAVPSTSPGAGITLPDLPHQHLRELCEGAIAILKARPLRNRSRFGPVVTIARDRQGVTAAFGLVGVAEGGPEPAEFFGRLNLHGEGGDPMIVGLQAHYLRDALALAPDRMEIWSDTKPVLIGHRDAYFSIFMPYRL